MALDIINKKLNVSPVLTNVITTQIKKYDELPMGDQAAYGRELVVVTNKNKIAINIMSNVLKKKEEKITVQGVEIGGLRKQLSRNLNEIQLASYMKCELEKADPLSGNKNISSDLLEALEIYIQEEESRNTGKK